MSAQPVDVLAVMKEASGFALSQSYSLPTNEECEQAEALVTRINEARAAVAELVEAAKKAQAMMAIPDRIEPRHRQELCAAIARCEVVADPRLARVQGGAA